MRDRCILIFKPPPHFPENETDLVTDGWMHRGTSNTCTGVGKVCLSALVVFIFNLPYIEANYCCTTPDFGDDNSAPERAECRQASTGIGTRSRLLSADK